MNYRVSKRRRYTILKFGNCRLFGGWLFIWSPETKCTGAAFEWVPKDDDAHYRGPFSCP